MTLHFVRKCRTTIQQTGVSMLTCHRIGCWVGYFCSLSLRSGGGPSWFTSFPLRGREHGKLTASCPLHQFERVAEIISVARTIIRKLHQLFKLGNAGSNPAALTSYPR